MTPYYRDDLAELWHHDARRVSDVIEPETVDLLVTSPPYFALRSYRDGGEHYAAQIGSEATPGEFIDALIACTAEWCKVLRPTGSMFVNLGDKRSQRVAIRHSSHQDGLFPDRPELAKDWKRDKALGLTRMPYQNVPAAGAPPIREKSRMLLPHRYAIACEDRLGLIVRSDLVWSKPNGLPESVTDRCRDSHEYVFHLTRQGRYYSAIDEVREPHIGGAHPGLDTRHERSGNVLAPQRSNVTASPLGKLPGSVWTIPSEPLVVTAELGVDHFAAFPSELPRRCILGWTPPGYCLECGQARRLAVISHGLDMSRPQARRAMELAATLTDEHIVAIRSVGISDTGRGAATQNGTGKNTPEVYRLADEARQVLGGYAREYLLQRPTAFGYSCDCPTPDAPTRPAVVLDPFAGTGTTIAVAKALGRKGIGIDLSRDYLRLAEWRVNDPKLRRKVLERTGIKVPQPPAHDGQEALFT